MIKNNYRFRKTIILFNIILSLLTFTYGLFALFTNKPFVIILCSFINTLAWWSVFFIERIFKRKFKIIWFLCVDYYIILSMTLGTVFRMYDYIAFWDTICHMHLGYFVGLFTYATLKGNSYILKVWQKVIIVFAVICMVGVVWEIMEFTVDSLLNYNSQHNDTTGVKDTMWDFISNSIGGIIVIIQQTIVDKIKKKKLV